MLQSPQNQLTLYAPDGRRKYLTADEWRAFVTQASTCPREDVATFCLLLAHAGCRISEALALRQQSFHAGEGCVAIVCLKKRGRIKVRQVPLPDTLLERLSKFSNTMEPVDRLWPWSRGHAWKLVRDVLTGAGVRDGPHATAKGLRHALGVRSVAASIPLNMVQRWLGHESISTTAVYAELMGPEERTMAKRLWIES